VSTNDNGIFEFYESQISQNYAMKNPIGLIFFADKASVIGSSTQVYENEMMTQTMMETELNS